MKLKVQDFISSLTVLFVISLTTTATAGITVFTEGAYTPTDLVTNIYAKITGDPLVSAGVKVTYNPADLDTPVVQKNEAIWFMGAGGAEYAYRNPEHTSNSVIILLGKLDSTNPLAGVSGDRVLLATLKFRRLSAQIPTITLTLGRGGNYANFVTVPHGEVLDMNQVSFTNPLIRERGDANADGYITNLDMFAVKNLIAANVYKVHADCNADGYITNLDMFCIKNK